MTAEELKKQFRAEGKTLTEWATQHGFKRNEVYKVLNGVNKACWGRGHEIAKALGIK